MATPERLIAQNLNAVNPRVREWVTRRDGSALTRWVAGMVRRGVRCFDLMLCLPGWDPVAVYAWAIQTLQKRFPEIRFALDISDPEVIRTVRAYCRKPPILNGPGGWPPSRAMREILADHRGPVIVPCASRTSVRLTPRERLAVAHRYYRLLKTMGYEDNRMYFDPQLFPLVGSPPDQSPRRCLETVRLLRRYFPRCHRILGLENLTFRLRRKTDVQAAFLAAAVAAGLDAVILNARKVRLVKTWRRSRRLFPESGRAGPAGGVKP